jgi:hypothetical protein
LFATEENGDKKWTQKKFNKNLFSTLKNILFLTFLLFILANSLKLMPKKKKVENVFLPIVIGAKLISYTCSGYWEGG